MKKLFNTVKNTLRGGGANKYDAVMETDCVLIVSNVYEIYSYAAGKTKDGWYVFAYDYVPEHRLQEVYKNGYMKAYIDDKTYKISFDDHVKYVSYRRLLMPNPEGPFTFDKAVERLKTLEAQGRKGEDLRIENPRVEPDRHYSKFQTPDDVPKRRKRIRHWKP